MSVKLWAFRDGSGKIRVTPTDPSEVLTAAGLQKFEGVSPGGVSMRDLRRLFRSTEEMLLGHTGKEGFVEFTLGDLTAEALAALMVPVPEVDDTPDPI